MSSRKRIFDKIRCVNRKCGKPFKQERGKSSKCPRCGTLNPALAPMTAGQIESLRQRGIAIEGPRVQAALSEDDAARVKTVYENFGWLTNDQPDESLEDFERSFMKDPPGDLREREIKTWEKAMVIFHDYMKAHPDTHTVDQKTIAGMIMVYTGYPPDQAKALNANYEPTLAGKLHEVLVKMGAKDCK